MKNKILLAGIALTGAVCAVALDGYMEIAARQRKHKSLIGSIASKLDSGDYSEMCEFTKHKVEWIEQQKTERVSITSDRGNLLRGYLTLNDKKSRVFVLGIHGCHSDHNGDPANFMRYYMEKGFNFLSVDHTAHGESGGNFIGYDYFDSMDCMKWLDYLLGRFGKDIEIIVHGVSMGGATVCKMADSLPEQVKFAVADCPYTSALEEFDYVAKNAGVKHSGFLLQGINFLNKHLAKYDLKDTDVRASVKNARVPMLFVHGGADDFVPTKMGIELYDLCGSEKELMIVDGAEHAQSIRVDETGYHKKLDAFIENYIKE